MLQPQPFDSQPINAAAAAVGGPRFLSIERLCQRPQVLQACDVLRSPSLGEVLAGIGRLSASLILHQNDLIHN